MAHAVAAYLAQRNLYTALLADYTAVLKPLVLTTQTFVIFYRAKYFGAKQALSFRFEGPIVDCFWLFYLSK
jgi:hypothetical protein